VYDRIELGRICRLQVQTSSLKAGPPKGRYYDPSPLRQVDQLELTTDGAVTTIDGERIVDVHNASHPETKNRHGINPLSIGFTSHYDRMRERFDLHLVNGIAGENMLVEASSPVGFDQARGGFVIEGDDGRRIELGSVSIAHPCVEFSRFALDDRAAAPLVVSGALGFLDNGVRGFYVSVAASEPLRVEVGDRVYAKYSG
jgi:hypothetical protein